MITKKEVASKRRQGSGWIVVTYEPQYDGWAESHEMTYYAACRAVKEARENWNTKEQRYDN